MIEFIDGNLRMTKGDALSILVVIYTPSGEIYEMQDGDVVTFQVLPQVGKSVNRKPFIKKTITGNSIKLNEEDTLYLNENHYIYECQLTRANGDKDTFAKGDFILE